MGVANPPAGSPHDARGGHARAGAPNDGVWLASFRPLTTSALPRPDIGWSVTIYDRTTGEELTAATVSNETSGVLVVTDERPEVLLEVACEAYVRSLYEAT